MFKKIKNTKKGFTLIELLVSIAIMSLIITIAIPAYQSSSRNTKRKMYRAKLELANQGGKLWGSDNIPCFKSDGCSDKITSVDCTAGGFGANNKCYVIALKTLASEGYYSFDDDKGNIINPIDKSQMNEEQILLVYNDESGTVNNFSLKNYLFKIVTFDPSTQRTQNHTVTITDLDVIDSIRTNTGLVSFDRDKDNITLNFTNAIPYSTGWNPKLYNKPATANNISSVNTFSNTYSYDDGEYSGTLNKNGSSSAISGAYTAADTKYVSGENSSNYNSNGYTGTLSLYVYSGSYTPADTTYVTNQSSSSYNSGGYTGTLSQYVHSGSYTAADTKTVTGQSSASYNSGGYVGTLTKYVASGSYTAADTKTVTGQSSASYNSGGYVGTLTKYVYSGSYTKAHTKSFTKQELKKGSRKYKYVTGGGWNANGTTNPSFPASVSYSSGGYSGTLSKSGSSSIDGTGPSCSSQYPKPSNGQVCTQTVDWVCTYKGNITKPASDTRVYKYKGSVTKPASDTRVYRYQGNVTRPASDTRVYRYQGNVTRPESDTRVWRQDYSGTVYKGGEEDLYSYTVSIAYNLKQ